MSDIRGYPTYDPAEVKRLASNEETFGMYQSAADDSLGFDLDDEGVREVVQRIDEFTFLKSEPTRQYHRGTMSDYYTGYVEECATRIFLKFLIHDGVLIVTSFKEDDQYAY
jgi:hypothetical protein